MTTQILWIVGALGTGKSDTSFHAWNRLRTAGTSIGRLDLDDIGMCHPQPVDDAENHRLKAAAMAAVWSTFRDHGAECLVLSGGVNTPEEARVYLSQLPDAAWTVCRLTVNRPERHRRIAARAMFLGLSESAIALTTATSDDEEAVLAAAEWPDLTLDIDGLRPNDVVELVLRRTGWPRAIRRPDDVDESSS